MYEVSNFSGNGVIKPEYLELSVSPDTTRNVRVSVSFDDAGTMPDRNLDLAELLSCLSTYGASMEFDEHPCSISQIAIDFTKRTARLKVQRQDKLSQAR